MIHRFCISHQQPLLPESWYDDCICLGEFQPDSLHHVRHLDQFWHNSRPIAYGAAGTHILPMVIEKFASDATLIEVSNHRKRTLPSGEGIESQVFPTLRELSLEKFDKTDTLSLFTPRTGIEFLVPQPIHIKTSVLQHYAAVHRRRDILDYAALAVEMDILDSKSSSEFLASKYFIPGGVEIGIYPKEWLVHTWTGLEIVGREFLMRYGSRLEKYNRFQIRAVGFLAERLGSFLLLRHLIDTYSNNIPADIFGHLSVIIPDDSGYSGGLADQPTKRSRWHPLSVKRTR